MESHCVSYVLHFVLPKLYFNVRDFCFFEVSLPTLHELLRPNGSLTLEKDSVVRDSVVRDSVVRDSVVRDSVVFMCYSYIPCFDITTLIQHRRLY